MPIRESLLPLTTNDAGFEIIRDHEGLRTKAYQDVKGIWTIGYGHTLHVKKGDTCTEAIAEVWLKEDAKRAENTIRRYVTVDLNENQFSALVSFVFNLGGGNFVGTPMLRLINEDKMEEAMDHLVLYDKAHIDGRVVTLPGLTTRRHDEKRLFLTPVGEDPKLTGPDPEND